MWQITAYCIMGAVSNDPAKLAYFTGLCMSPFLSDMFAVAKCLFLIRLSNPLMLLAFGVRMVKKFCLFSTHILDDNS